MAIAPPLESAVLLEKTILVTVGLDELR